MKHRFSILAFVLLLSQTAWAQMDSYEAFVGTHYAIEHEGAVVRHWKGNLNVVFYNDNSVPTNSGIYFLRVSDFMSGSYSSDAATFYKVPPIGGLVVKDLYVLGDTTYFCGSYAGSGVYGYFINDTMTSYLSYNLYPVSQVDTLRKLVVSRGAVPGVCHLTAIGVQNSTGYSCILESPNVLDKTQTYSLAFVNTLADGNHEEVLDDVLLTDDYVVFVSRDMREGVGELSFRYSSPLNVLGDPLVHTHYHLPTAGTEAAYPVAVTRMEGNGFAVGYTAGGAAETRVHYLAAGSGIALLHSQRTTQCGGVRMMDMAYHGSTGKLTLLWPDLGGYSHFYTFSPYVTGAQFATHINYPRTRCYSIDDMDGAAFVAFGGNGITMQRTFAPLDFRLKVKCMGAELAGIDTYQVPPVSTVTEPLKMKTYTVIRNPQSGPIASPTMYRYCFSH